ncbi:MAG: hypothetical protein IAG13_03620 [Deltaproteobacteria bacterium]|nr:hypothetical protein [Nannocystaceae bacterium]
MGRINKAGWGVLALGLGCGELRKDSEQTTVSAGSMSASSADSGSDEADGSTTEVAPSSSSDGGVKLDVGAGGTENMTADEGGDQDGCDKVDFLFIVDNSGSMSEEQDSLISAFPQFIGTIQDTLDEAQDYHVMVLDTDAFVYEGCLALCAFPIPPDNPNPICLIAPEYECGSDPLECEDVLGAGVTHPRGAQSSNADCEFASGMRWMDSAEPDLAGAFSCAARVGTGSTLDPEKPMEAMVAASTASTPAFACNEGFFRDDAILVVTFVTDEDDAANDGSGGTVAGWREALIAAKNGDENAVVVLGLFGDGDMPGAICTSFDSQTGNGAEPSPRLREFTESWGDRGIAGSICAPSYDEFFEQAVGVIDTTCDEFEPPAG